MKLRHVLVVVVLLTQHKQHQHNHTCINMHICILQIYNKSDKGFAIKRLENFLIYNDQQLYLQLS